MSLFVFFVSQYGNRQTGKSGKNGPNLDKACKESLKTSTQLILSKVKGRKNGQNDHCCGKNGHYCKQIKRKSGH